MFIFLRMLEKNFNGEIFNLAIQNIKIIDLAYQIKNHFLNLDIDIIQTRDDQDKRNYNVDIKKMLKVSKFKPRFTIEKGIKEIFDNLMIGKSKRTEKTSTLGWYKYLIDSKKTLDEVLINGKLFLKIKIFNLKMLNSLKKKKKKYKVTFLLDKN